MRRAQLQHPMNWILILFAGFFFLLLFVAIANNVTRTAQTTDDVITVSRITSSLEQTRASPGTRYELQLNNLETSCADVFTLEFSGQLEPLRGHPIFAQRTLDGTTTMFSEQLRIDKPYTTITYLYTQDTTLYLSQDLTINTRNYLTERFRNVQLFDQDDLPSSFSGTKTITVFHNDLPDSWDGVSLRSGQDFKAISITSLNSGTATYMDSTYIEYPSSEFLLAAIISPDKQTYDCGVRLAEQRVQFTAKLLLNRTQQLREHHNTPLCTNYYQQAEDALIGLTNIDLSQSNAISQARIDLRYTNTRLAANSCPET